MDCLTTIFDKSPDQKETHRVNYVFPKFLMQQYENILKQSLYKGF